MPSIEELLNEAESHMAAQPVNDVLEINPETREISIPDSEIILGVETDQKAERKYFHCPKIVGNNIDLSALELYVVFQNASNKEEGKDRYHVTDVKTTSDGYITFSWELSEKVTAYKGDVQFVVCAIKTDSSGVKQNVWNTTIAIGKCLIGLSSDMSASEEQSASDLYTQLISELNSTASAKLAEVTTQIQTVGNNQVSNVNNAGTTQVSNVQNKGTEVLASIPDTYTELDASVKQLNEQIKGKAPVITESTTIQSGSPTTVTDSAEMQLQGLRLYGKSLQETTTGKNLSSIKSCQLSTNMVSSDIVPWTKSSQIYYAFDTQNISGAQAYISIKYHDADKKKVGSNGNNIACDGTRKTGSFNGKYADNGSDIDLTTIEYISVQLGLYRDSATPSFIDNIMVSDDKNAPYEPYTGGKPSPSPDYPQEIVSVGQKLSTGKNLINADEYYSQFKQSDGTYKGENTVINKIAIPLAHFVGKRIVISANIDFPSTIDTMQIRAAIGENNYYGDIVYPNTNKRSVLTVTVQTQNDNFWFTYGSGSGQVIISDIQVELGSTATSYEPYTGGKPAPYKTDCGIEITRKNLFNANDVSEGVISDDNGNNMVATNSYCSNFIAVSAKTKYYLYSGQDGGRWGAFYDSSKTFILGIGPDKYNTVFETPENAAYVRFTVNYNNNNPDFARNVIFAKSTIAVPFEPYHKSTTTIPLSNGLPGIPVTAGGNYTDENGQQYICNEIDFAAGKYVQRVWQAEFDGSEDEKWKKVVTNYIYIECLPVAMTSRKGFCSQYIVGDDTRGIRIGNSNKALIIFGDFSDENALSNFKANLSANPFKVMTYLDTPIETDLTEAQIQAYKSLTTFKPTSIISNDANAQMKVEYACDTKTWVTNKINTLIKEATTS